MGGEGGREGMGRRGMEEGTEENRNEIVCIFSVLEDEEGREGRERRKRGRDGEGKEWGGRRRWGRRGRMVKLWKRSEDERCILIFMNRGRGGKRGEEEKGGEGKGRRGSREGQKR